ncbi:hypothetical protein [Psychromonas sp. Urea-02u-13]|uniref:hypothetical protein n=1 Tax=Psychromonas sp. Urea-02u-13 TaxID=2058326 RepID=UPI000C34F861|nr:hypothetical protein [Psychromonas sp. Urea-02u-13]PKG36922.1 hypothetical protein CXF74_21620 [Psychromonas sp. Urea-02u-13]
MAIYFYDTFEEASEFAKYISLACKATIKLGRDNNRFFVDIPDDTKPPEGIEDYHDVPDERNFIENIPNSFTDIEPGPIEDTHNFNHIKSIG